MNWVTIWGAIALVGYLSVSVGAFIRAHRETKVNDGWASDTFYLGVFALILAIDTANNLLGAAS